jgi:hypothetical protein
VKRQDEIFALLDAKGRRGIFGCEGRPLVSGILVKLDAIGVAEVFQSFELATV